MHNCSHIFEDKDEEFVVHERAEGDALGVVGFGVEEDIGTFFDDDAGLVGFGVDIHALEELFYIFNVEGFADLDVSVAGFGAVDFEFPEKEGVVGDGRFGFLEE